MCCVLTPKRKDGATTKKTKLADKDLGATNFGRVKKPDAQSYNNSGKNLIGGTQPAMPGYAPHPNTDTKCTHSYNIYIYIHVAGVGSPRRKYVPHIVGSTDPRGSRRES